LAHILVVITEFYWRFEKSAMRHFPITWSTWSS